MKTLDQVARSEAVYDVLAWKTPGLHRNDIRVVATFLRPDDACAFASALPDKCGERVRVVTRGSTKTVIAEYGEGIAS